MAGAFDTQFPTTGLRARQDAPAARMQNTYGALEQTGNELFAAAEQEDLRQQKEDKVLGESAARRAAVDLAATESEYMQHQGEDAAKEFGSLDQKYTGVRETYTKDLTPAQAAAFDAQFDVHKYNTMERTIKHRDDQTTKVDLANSEAQIVTATQDAILSADDPHKVAQAHQQVTANIAAYADKMGVPAGSPAEQALMLEKFGEFHSGVINHYLTTEQSGKASQYLKAYGDQVSPELRDKLQKSIAEQNNFYVGKSVALAAFNPNRTVEDATAMIMSKGLNEKTENAALSTLGSLYTAHNASERQRDEFAWKSFQNAFITKGMTPAEAVAKHPQEWLRLTKAQKDSLTELTATPPLPDAEQAALENRLTNAAAVDPKGFEQLFLVPRGGTQAPTKETQPLVDYAQESLNATSKKHTAHIVQTAAVNSGHPTLVTAPANATPEEAAELATKQVAKGITLPAYNDTVAADDAAVKLNEVLALQVTDQQYERGKLTHVPEIFRGLDAARLDRLYTLKEKNVENIKDFSASSGTQNSDRLVSYTKAHISKDKDSDEFYQFTNYVNRSLQGELKKQNLKDINQLDPQVVEDAMTKATLTVVTGGGWSKKKTPMYSAKEAEIRNGSIEVEYDDIKNTNNFDLVTRDLELSLRAYESDTAKVKRAMTQMVKDEDLMTSLYTSRLRGDSKAYNAAVYHTVTSYGELHKEKVKEATGASTSRGTYTRDR